MRPAVAVLAGVGIVGCAAQAARAQAGPEEPTRFVRVPDVSAYLENPDSPRATGCRFPVVSTTPLPSGEARIEAVRGLTLNGFRMRYTLTARAPVSSGAADLNVSDLEDVKIVYQDDALDFAALEESAIDRLIESLARSENRAVFGPIFIPGGNGVELSHPMTMLILFGERARRPLEERLSDPRIQEEAVRAGARGLALQGEATCPGKSRCLPGVPDLLSGDA